MIKPMQLSSCLRTNNFGDASFLFSGIFVSTARNIVFMQSELDFGSKTTSLISFRC